MTKKTIFKIGDVLIKKEDVYDMNFFAILKIIDIEFVPNPDNNNTDWEPDEILYVYEVLHDTSSFNLTGTTNEDWETDLVKHYNVQYNTTKIWASLND